MLESGASKVLLQSAPTKTGAAPNEEPATHEDDYLWLLAFAPDQVRSSPLWGPLVRGRLVGLLPVFELANVPSTFN